MVDSEDHTYLTSKNYVVTHNTTSLSVASIEGNFDSILIICPVGLKTNWKRELMWYVDEKYISIVDGFNNFGERELKYYYDKLENLNKVLSDNNSHILFIRGNDDPKYFEDELINLSNIKTIQDYSVIKLSKFNCLCIGGCVSIDRAWRKEQEKRVGRKMYWEGENIQYNEEDIDKILKEYDIACVITSSSPSFTFPGMNHIKNSSWVSEDKQVFKDIKDERLIMDKIYNKLTNANKKPYVWIYSRYNNSYQGMNNDIVFQSLYNFQFFSFKQSVESIFGVDFSKNLKSNGYGSKKQATK
jgi:hypothetical protein